MDPTADSQPLSEIRSRPCPTCGVCGSPGEVLYDGLRDRLFGAPGVWTFKRCSRPECGLVWLDPVPLEEDIHLAYASYHTHENVPAPRPSRLRFLKLGYLSHRYGYRASAAVRVLGMVLYFAPKRRAKVDSQAFYLPAMEQGRLLDVGCGSGQELRWMAELRWHAEGVEPDPAAVQVAREKGLTVHQGTLASQRFPDASFDAVVSSHVIEHVHDPLAFLRESRRILRPGGRLVVITPNIRSWGHRLYRRAWRGLEPPRHLQVFSRLSLAALADKAGFAARECSAITRSAGDILLASRRLRRNESASTGGFSRLWAGSMALAEWARAYLDRDAGEELVLIAHD